MNREKIVSASPSGRLRILFLCTGNSCRSQMAEGFAKALRGNRIEAFSAGTVPQGLNPNAVRVMAELGIDISMQRSKYVEEFLGQPLDYVITVCGHANETCPVFPGQAKRLHVGFDDPPALAAKLTGESARLDCYRRVRDQIREFIETLPESLTTP